ncbi:paraoxonase 3, putative [Ichthyophthirius multifiliis]|uniref:Paraoxonase 3, putative n=1 Tax=Ichthyophthirius multifiliis TaxID=5932 RepID=G0R087_ICHMU|nr:paraoxonase 3, putative [Ichthyophthirius multifiliis]EGR29119.1 paraoxonase 3, putative [Ichthyophthirius multifiliis]|eukprot:XP_004030355.1 paraoxonase 3, putative [Ichthyophthirius multifiliis]
MIYQLIFSLLIAVLIPSFFFQQKSFCIRISAISLLSLIIFISYTILKFGFFEQPIPIDIYSNCNYLENTIGPEDFAKVDSNSFLFSSNDNIQQWEIGGPNKTQNGHIYLLKMDKNLTSQYKLKLENFPQTIPFHPHGIYFRQEDQVLFVINHPYIFETPGDRIEIFKFNEQNKTLIYLQSIYFGQQYNGILNNLIVFDKGKLLVTQYLSTTDPKEGRTGRNKFRELADIAEVLFELEYTYVLSCLWKEEYNQQIALPQCTVLKNTKGTINNGITWDKEQNIVFVSDIGQSKINVYNLKKEDGNLEKTNEIQTLVQLDNINFDEENKQIIGGGLFRMIDYVNFIQGSKQKGEVLQNMDIYWCGILEINYQKNLQKIIYSNKNSPIGCTIAFKGQNNTLFIGNFGDKGIYKCQS